MWQKIVVAFGRVLIASIFFVGGLSKIFHWNQTLIQIQSVFSDWKAYVAGTSLESFFEALIPMSAFLLILAIALELIGGASVLIGYKPKWGALCLILFLIPTTIFFHHFWFLEGIARSEEQMAFIKNVAILGGLFILFGHEKKTLHRL